MSSILVIRLVAAVNAANLCGSITMIMNLKNVNYLTVLATFKVEHEVCVSTKHEDNPKVSKINDRDKDCKIIRWSLISKDCLANMALVAR